MTGHGLQGKTLSLPNFVQQGWNDEGAFPMSWLAYLKPGANVRTHLLTAALMWSSIGVYLLVRGFLLAGGMAVVPFLVAFGVGSLKALLVLDRSVRRNIVRIRARQDGACLGGVYSWQMWGGVVIMMIAGRLLRGAVFPASVIGVVYVAVGWGLLLSSRLFWKQWRA